MNAREITLNLLMVSDGCDDLLFVSCTFSFFPLEWERRRVLFEGQLYPVYSVVQRKPRSAIKINMVRAGRTEQSRGTVFPAKYMLIVV